MTDNEPRMIEALGHSPEPAPVMARSGPLSLPTTLIEVRARTPARILNGRAGAAYRTATWLELRSDHAAARDAVRTEFGLTSDLGEAFVSKWGLFEVATRAHTKEEFLLRPDLGRSLNDAARAELAQCCMAGADFQVAIADGLSAAAVRTQIPALLPLLAAEAFRRGWRFGHPFFIRHGRVGTLNDIGEILDPTVAVLLIGERPGLATAESLSAYMAYRPRAGHDDARRNLLSNIHNRGVPPDQAASRIAQLAARMIQLETSGVAVKEEWRAETSPRIAPGPKIEPHGGIA
jgi:ethanolamine ammonia-lyase small subunit